jgi:hypothetical protein
LAAFPDKCAPAGKSRQFNCNFCVTFGLPQQAGEMSRGDEPVNNIIAGGVDLVFFVPVRWLG